MNTLDDCYLALLRSGMNVLRNSLCAGEMTYAQIESEHLHGIPELISSDHLYSHVYYFTSSRETYLKQIQQQCPDKIAPVVNRYYLDIWDTMRPIIEGYIDQMGDPVT